MIHSIKFKEDWRCFSGGATYKFHSGVNLLVGEQGCGKSSLLDLIRIFGMPKKKRDGVEREIAEKASITHGAGTICSFDFEKGNPRTLAHFGRDAGFQIKAMFASHGETNTAIIKNAVRLDSDLILMDEPDSALSIRSCQMLVSTLKKLAKSGSQIIAAVHNPIVIQAFGEVYSVEHDRWMLSEEFISSHLECEHCGCVPCGCGG